MRGLLLTTDAAVARFTPDEPWSEKRDRNGHWYNAQADYAVAHLKGEGKCLVVGSPIFEAKELEASGLDITYLDVRRPPLPPSMGFIQADATSIPVESESFDFVSSTCVLCHAGMGRYGDPIVEDGDELMLGEIARVLKKGGRAALTFGPVTSAVDELVRVEDCHRIYTLKEAMRMASAAGLRVVDVGVYELKTASWLPNVPVNLLLDAYYLSMCVEK